MISKITAIFAAMRAGQSLENPAIWKNRQALITTFCSLIALVPNFISISLSQEEITTIATFLAAGVGVFNIYFTYATSEKVGPGEKK